MMGRQFFIEPAVNNQGITALAYASFEHLSAGLQLVKNTCQRAAISDEVILIINQTYAKKRDRFGIASQGIL